MIGFGFLMMLLVIGLPVAALVGLGAVRILQVKRSKGN